MWIFFDYDFAREGAIDESEVASGENHADDPPGQADLEAVVGGFCAVGGQRVDGIARGKNHWVDAEDDASEHAGDVQARREEGFAFVVFDEFELDAGETCYGEQRQNQAQRPGGEIFFYLWLDLEGDCGDDHGECELCPPYSACQGRGSLAYRAVGFHAHPESAVHHQDCEGQHADQDGVPVENSDVVAELKISPQWFEEIAAGVEGNAANDVG